MDSYFQNKMFSSYYGTKSFIQQEKIRNPGSQPKRHHALKIVSPECRQNCTDKIGYSHYLPSKKVQACYSPRCLRPISHVKIRSKSGTPTPAYILAWFNETFYEGCPSY